MKARNGQGCNRLTNMSGITQHTAETELYARYPDLAPTFFTYAIYTVLPPRFKELYRASFVINLLL